MCPVTTSGIFQLQWPSILSDAAIRHPSQLSSPQPEKLRDVDLPEKEKFKGIIRRLMFELANVDATVRALSSTKEKFPTFVDAFASSSRHMPYML